MARMTSHYPLILERLIIFVFRTNISRDRTDFGINIYSY